MKIWGRPAGVVARWSPPKANHDEIYIQVRSTARGRRTAIDLATEQQQQTGGEVESIMLDGEQAARVWNAEKGIGAVGVTHGEMQYLITCRHVPNDRGVLDAFCANWKFSDPVPLSQDTQLDPQRLRIIDRFTIQLPPWVRWAKDFKGKVDVVGWFGNASVSELPQQEMFTIVIDMPAEVQRVSTREFLDIVSAMLMTMSSTTDEIEFRRLAGPIDFRITNPVRTPDKPRVRFQAATASFDSTRVAFYIHYECDTPEAQAAFAKLTESIIASIKPVKR